MSRGTTNDKHAHTAHTIDPDTAHTIDPDTAMPGEDTGIGSPSMSQPPHVQSASDVNLSLTQPTQAGFDNPLSGRTSGDTLPLSEPTQAQFGRLMNHGRSGRDLPLVAQAQLNATVSGESTTIGGPPVNEPEQVQVDGFAAYETSDDDHPFTDEDGPDIFEIWDSLCTAYIANQSMRLSSGTFVQNGENDPSHPPLSSILKAAFTLHTASTSNAASTLDAASILDAASTLNAASLDVASLNVASILNAASLNAASTLNAASLNATSTLDAASTVNAASLNAASTLNAASLNAFPWKDMDFGVTSPMNQPAQVQSDEFLADGADHSTSHQFTAQMQPKSRPETPMSDGGSSVTLVLDDHAQVRSGTPMSDGGSSVTLHTGEPRFRSDTPMSDNMDDDMSDDIDDDIDDDGFEDDIGDEMWDERSEVIIEDLWEELRDGKVVDLADEVNAATSDAMEDAVSDCIYDADDAQTENMGDNGGDVSDEMHDASDRSGLSDGSSWTAPLILVVSPTQVEAHMLSVGSSDVNHLLAPDSTHNQLGGTTDGEGTSVKNLPLVHPVPLRVQPDFGSVINHAETSGNEGGVPRLVVSPSLTAADFLRNHLAVSMLGYAFGTGLTSVHMCYLPEIPRRLEQSVALRNSVYYFCLALRQFYTDSLQDVDESYGYFRASHGIQEELEMVLRFAKYGLADRLVTPELLAALTLTERTLKLFKQGGKAREYARSCKDLIAELWLVRGPPDLNDPLDTAVSNEIHGLLIREGCEVDITRIAHAPWNEALALCAVGRPTTAVSYDTDNRPFMMNDHIKLHGYTSKLEPLFVDMMKISTDFRNTRSLARKVRSRLQSIRDDTIFASVCASGRGGEDIGHDLRPMVYYYGKSFYLKAVMLAHIFQKMVMHEFVPLQLVYEMSYVIGISPANFLQCFDKAEHETPEYEVWTRIPQEVVHFAEKAVRHIEPKCPQPMLMQAMNPAVDDDPFPAPYDTVVWSPVDDRNFLNIPFCDLAKLRLFSSLHSSRTL
ncbi:unnamed protein product [Clonostachys solani]|uniref:Uncharacterized protein n=1 Tax=Clonostachys solani TaxID=160281 RepID=A0A9N9YZH0_9HYPO|nr:unnamed protein product [Clonostachys solani]